MRTFVISLAATASALAVATPAAAQYYPQQPYGYGYPSQPQGYGYGYPSQPQGYGYGYGYHNNYGQVRRLQARIDQLQHRIARLDSRDRISEREARRLREESRNVERHLRRAARYGLHPQEAYSIEHRIARLEQHIRRDVRDGNRWGRRYGYGQGYGQRGYWDRDRDGRDDHWEDDRGRDRDD